MALLDIQVRVKHMPNGAPNESKYVEGEVVRVNRKTVWVKLPDGSIIKRKLERDLR